MAELYTCAPRARKRDCGVFCEKEKRRSEHSLGATAAPPRRGKEKLRYRMQIQESLLRPSARAEFGICKVLVRQRPLGL